MSALNRYESQFDGPEYDLRPEDLDYSRPSKAELDQEEFHSFEPDPEFDAWLIDLLKVECAGCGTEFNSSCEVCHPF